MGCAFGTEMGKGFGFCGLEGEGLDEGEEEEEGEDGGDHADVGGW